jgi:hypothetical protein
VCGVLDRVDPAKEGSCWQGFLPGAPPVRSRTPLFRTPETWELHPRAGGLAPGEHATETGRVSGYSVGFGSFTQATCCSIIRVAMSRSLVLECEEVRTRKPNAASGSSVYFAISSPTA